MRDNLKFKKDKMISLCQGKHSFYDKKTFYVNKTHWHVLQREQEGIIEHCTKTMTTTFYINKTHSSMLQRELEERIMLYKYYDIIL